MDACDFGRASVFVLQKFGLDKFTDVQKHALKELLVGKDVCQSTYRLWKVLIFQAMPLLYDYMFNAINSDQSDAPSENQTFEVLTSRQCQNNESQCNVGNMKEKIYLYLHAWKTHMT